MSFHGGPTGVGDRLCAFLTCVGFDMARASATWNSTHGCEYAAARLERRPGASFGTGPRSYRDFGTALVDTRGRGVGVADPDATTCTWST